MGYTRTSLDNLMIASANNNGGVWHRGGYLLPGQEVDTAGAIKII
jgi:hypothetical protein